MTKEDDSIEIKEVIASTPAEIIIREATPTGYMAWYRPNNTSYFNHVFGFKANEIRDYHRCPYPLFETKEDAIEAAKYALHGSGGEVRIVKVTL